MFLAECREHLQELNLAVVRLEEDPHARETVDEIFRAAHSLKGMAATMGFEGMARLTHQMEDVFELLRQREGALTSEVTDVVLACLDALETATDAIEADGSEQLDPEALVTRLQGLVRTVDGPQAEAEEAPAPAPALTAVPADGSVLEVAVTLAPDCSMPSVRAFMVLSTLAGHGTVVSSSPTEAECDGFTGKEITALVATSAEADTVAAGVREVPEVGAVTVGIPVPAEPQPVVEDAREDRRHGRSPRGPRRRRDRPRRRRAPRPAHAPDGRARRPAHPRRGPRRRHRDHRPAPGDAGPDPQLPGPAGDGHADPHDPRRGGLPALPAPGARRQLEARQAGRPAARRPGDGARPHRRRRARRPAGPPHPQLARPRPRDAGRPRRRRQVADRHADDLRPPRRWLGRHLRARRRPRDRSREGRRQGGRARADHRRPGPVHRRAGRDRAALRGRLLHRRDRRRPLRSRRRHGRRARQDPPARRRGPRDLRHRRGHRGADPPPAHAGDHVRAARRGRRAPVRHPAAARRAHPAHRRPADPQRGRPEDARDEGRGPRSRCARPPTPSVTRTPTPAPTRTS